MKYSFILLCCDRKLVPASQNLNALHSRDRISVQICEFHARELCRIIIGVGISKAMSRKQIQSVYYALSRGQWDCNYKLCRWMPNGRYEMPQRAWSIQRSQCLLRKRLPRGCLSNGGIMDLVAMVVSNFDCWSSLAAFVWKQCVVMFQKALNPAPFLDILQFDRSN